MLTVHKFQIYSASFGACERTKAAIRVPSEAKTLKVDEQYGNICVWMLVDTDNAPETRTFQLFGTGHEIPVDAASGFVHVGSVMLFSGRLVLHVFEQISC